MFAISDALRILEQRPRRARTETWHVWPVTIPRRSITGRLVWGTVWRRWDGHRWIYKKYTDKAS